MHMHLNMHLNMELNDVRKNDFKLEIINLSETFNLTIRFIFELGISEEKKEI